MAVDLDLARSRFQLWRDADQKQLKREEEDCAFYDNKQWPDDILRIRNGTGGIGGAVGASSVPSVPSRPCITVNKIKDRVRHVLNQIIQADLGISVVPADDWGGPTIDEKEIELREGLIRRIQRQSGAQAAIAWAGERATICGRGYFGFQLERLPGRTFDREVKFRRFYDQRHVGCDPAADEPDGSDAEYWFELMFLPWSKYKSEYGKFPDGRKNQRVGTTDSEFADWCDKLPAWFELQGTDDKKQRRVLVVRYWYYADELREIVLANPETGEVVDAAQVPPDVLKDVPADRRDTIVERKVRWCDIDGWNDDELADNDWVGKYFPFVRVLGEEIQPYDQEKRSEGMVRTAMDSQRAFNYMISSAVETIGLGPKATYIGAAGQFEGFEDMWNASVTRTIQRLEYNPTVAGAPGTVLGPPNRITAEPPIQAMAAMIPMFSMAISETTGIPDPMVGNVDPAIRSGKAIKALLDTALRGTSNYMENLVRSVQRGGVILNDLLAPVYNNRPGRIVRMVTGHDDTTPVMMQTPHVMQNGQPVPFNPEQHQGDQRQRYTLTKEGSFNIAVKVSPMFETRREQEATQLMELMSQNPQLMQFFGDLLFKYMDGPGHVELAERAKFGLIPPIQEMLQTGKPPDPVAAGKLAKQEQMIQMLAGQVQELQQQKAAKQTEMQGKYAIAEMENATKITVAEIQKAGVEAVAQFKAAMQGISDSVKAELEGRRIAVESEHEHRLADREHLHELNAITHQAHADIAVQAHAPKSDNGSGD